MDIRTNQIIPASLLEELHSLYLESSPLIEILYADLYISACKKKSESNISSGYYFLLQPTFCHKNRVSVFLDTYKLSIQISLILNELEKKLDQISSFKAISDLISTAVALKNKIPNISSSICLIKEDPELVSAKHIKKKLFLFIESLRALIEEIASVKNITIDQLIKNQVKFLTKEPLDLQGDFE